MKHVIIGTAGHVDHGKTEIVKALTGRNTDRLEEERRRGISIVLGFAPIDLGDGVEADIVDVPGHERFVKNMVSGAVGVDLALLVVAADEGVMPQTVEHFEVLRLLGVGDAVVAVTKTDLVDAETAGVVESEVRDMLKGSAMEDAPFVRTSAVTGEGIEKLRELLRAGTLKAKQGRGGDFFRLPVDRVFTRSGIGTVVTGTAWAGRVRSGDELVIWPGGKKVRVRDVHNFDRALSEGQAGMRTALALHGVKIEEIATGSQLLSPGAGEETSMINAVVEVSGIKGSRLVNRQRVRLHHAAAEILARAILLGRDEIGEGEKGFVQLRLESPAVAFGQDGFILRTYSPMRVLAGGRVLDPLAPKARRFRPELVAELEELSSRDPAKIIAALIAREKLDGISLKRARAYGIPEKTAAAEAAALEAAGAARWIGERLFSAAVLEESEKRMYSVLERFAAANPLIWGIDREQLRLEAEMGGGPAFDYLLSKGRDANRLFFRSGKVRAGSGQLELSQRDVEMIGALEKRIRDAGMQFAGYQDLIRLPGSEKLAVKYLHILQSEGRIKKIGGEGYMDSGVFDEMKKRLARILSSSGSMSVGEFKDEFGLSRKYAVPLLEHLDSEGITVRKGDSRVAGPALQEV